MSRGLSLFVVLVVLALAFVSFFAFPSQEKEQWMVDCEERCAELGMGIEYDRKSGYCCCEPIPSK